MRFSFLKKILRICWVVLLFAFVCFGVPERQYAQGTQHILYVSPSGNDTNPGTEALPWKTFYKASQTAAPGDLVLFEDGIYAESQQASIKNSGTSSQPIMFKARNKHKAILEYSGPSNSVKILNNGKKYITIADFEITQTTRGSSSSDKLIDFSTGSDHGVISGNKIHNAFEDLIKMYDSDFGIIEGNELYDSTREGIDFMIGNGLIIRNNILKNANRQALMIKGGARNAQVYNNTIIQDSATMYVAIGLGGSSDNIFAYDDSGYEGYHQVAFNNVVVARSPGIIQEALKMEGCDTCAHFNNVVVGADKAIVVTAGPGLAKNWTWDVLSRDPVFTNNIIVDCRVSTRYIPNTVQGTLTIDYNLIFNCPSPPTQLHGVSSDPKFVNKLSDWHLQTGSPAIGKGQVVAPFQLFSDANTPLAPSVNVGFDVTGAVRTDPWDMGIYESGLSAPTLTSTPTPLVGDVNNDGKVDLLDFNIWRDEFLGTVSTKLSDLSIDGIVDLVDFTIWLSAYRASNS